MQQIGIGGDSVFIKNTSQGIALGLDLQDMRMDKALLHIMLSLMLNELTTSIEIESKSFDKVTELPIT